MLKKSIMFMAALFVLATMSAKNVTVTLSPADKAQLIQKGKVVQPVSPGVYNIQVSIVDLVFTAQADGYDAESFVINLRSPVTMQINLKPNKKHVSVTSDPESATIYVDGRESGKGQVAFDINKGESKTIKLVEDGYDNYLKRINFNDQSDIIMTYNVEMIPNRKEVAILVDVPAEFFVDGISIGKGEKSAKFYVHKGKISQLVVRAEGYLELVKKISFESCEPSYNLTKDLVVDQAYASSVSRADIANKKMEFMIKKGMTREQATQRMKYYISELFETLEINDNVSGWYRTAWNSKTFEAENMVVRTRVELKEVPDNGDGQIKYKFYLQSQVAYKPEPQEGDFKPWNRILQEYDKLVSDIQNLVAN